MSEATPLLRHSSKPVSKWPEWLTIALLAAIVARTIPFHEPWADEAQAWQLARGLPLADLFKTYLRYEGSPGLWHFLLWTMIRLHIGYTAMHWVCGAIAVGSTSLLVLYAPFPRYLKLTLPFTFFLVYQYAVVARNYVLAPPLLFLVAIAWKRKPVLLALALGLLANLSLHAFVVAVGLSILCLTERLRGGDWDDARRRRILAICTAIVLAFCAFALWTAWPPVDMSAHIASQRQNTPPSWFAALIALLLPVAQPLLLSFPFWAAMLGMFYARRRLLYLLPVICFAAFSGAVIANFWHLGILISLLICISWITWPPDGFPAGRFEIAGRLALVWMVGTQLLWSVYALRFDQVSAYAPDRMTALFLMPYVARGTTIAISHLDGSNDHDATATGLLPYFDKSIFLNQERPFYEWSDRNTTESQFDAALPSRPQMVILEMQPRQPGAPASIDSPKSRLLIASGYRLTRVFCGSMPFRFQLPLTNCHLIYEYTKSVS